MNAASGLPPSKGMKMVATYRAERLNQRPILRTSLHASHVARRAARAGGRPVTEPAETAETEPSSPSSPAAETPGSTSVFAGLVSTAVVEQRAETGRWQGMQAELTRTETTETKRTTETTETTESNNAKTPPTKVANEAGQQGASETTAEPPPLQVARPEPEASSAQAHTPAADIAPPHQSAYDPPLAEIGFGPGMLIRLSQLGLYTTSDLAQADAFELRSALGDISRLVDVDAWIRSARQTIRSAASSAEQTVVPQDADALA